MNLRTYYQKIREVEETITEPFTVLVSHATADGGKEGALTEVSARLAARMIAEGSARLASADEARSFRQKALEAKRAADEEAIASKMQVTLVPSTELRKANRPTKE